MFLPSTGSAGGRRGVRTTFGDLHPALLIDPGRENQGDHDVERPREGPKNWAIAGSHDPSDRCCEVKASMDTYPRPDAAHDETEVRGCQGEAERDGEVDDPLQDVLLTALGDHVWDGESDHRDPDGAFGTIGEALQEVAAHDSLLPNALEHVATRENHENGDDDEPPRHSEVHRRRRNNRVENTGNDGDAADDDHRDPGAMSKVLFMKLMVMLGQLVKLVLALQHLDQELQT